MCHFTTGPMHTITLLQTSVILHLCGSIPKDFSCSKPMRIVCSGPTKKLATALITWRVALSVSAGIVRRSFNRWRSTRQHVLNSASYGTNRTCRHRDSLWTTTALVLTRLCWVLDTHLGTRQLWSNKFIGCQLTQSLVSISHEISATSACRCKHSMYVSHCDYDRANGAAREAENVPIWRYWV